MIYLDNNATTKPFPEAIKIFEESSFANPHSTHSAGLLADKELQSAKESIAKDIDCELDEIYFVGSPTEACNWAVQILRDKECKIKYHNYEHSAVLKPILAFPEVESPKRNGYVQMLVNNIYGEIYNIPIKEHNNDIIFCDGTAAIGHIPFSFKKSGIDMLAFGAHKFNGLRGIACLIIKKDLLPVRSLLWGGDITGGTPCQGLASAMAYALHKNIEYMNENTKKTKEMQDYIIDELTTIPFSRINGPIGNNRISNNVNISFSYISGSDLQKYLSDYNICVSTGSACDSSSFVESRGGICVRPLKKDSQREPELVTIFKAGGMDEDDAKNSIRITLDANYNTMEEIKEFVSTLKNIIELNRPI